MDYSQLGKIDFDAVVTGELTHRMLCLEESINDIIIDYFVENPARKRHFKRVILHREGLTFQDKIEILLMMVPLFQCEAERVNLPALLRNVEKLKGFRNAMAHGRDDSDETTPPKLKISMVNRAGKEVVREITPESHSQMLTEADKLDQELCNARDHLRKAIKTLA